MDKNLQMVLDILNNVLPQRVTPETELIESGLLDSMAVMQLFTELDFMGCDLQPSRVSRSALSTPKKIAEIIGEKTIESHEKV